MKDSPLGPNPRGVDDIEAQVIEWTHAGQRRALADELAYAALLAAVVTVGFCLQALNFHHWIFAAVLGAVTVGAAVLFKQSRAQLLECHEVAVAYQAGLGELGWKEIAAADPEDIHSRLKHQALATLAETGRTGKPAVQQGPLKGQNGNPATVNDVKRIHSAVVDLEKVFLHEAVATTRFKTGLVLAGIGLAWGTYGLLMGVSLNALIFTAALAVAAKAVGAKQAQPYLGSETKEDLLEFLDWYRLRPRYDEKQSHLELVTEQGAVVDPYTLQGVPAADG